MALFGSKKNKEAEEKSVQSEKPASSKKGEKSSRDVSHVLRQPRITEKATYITEGANVYAFEIDPRATKADVVLAMKSFYKVTPVKVNVVTIPKKRVRVRGKLGSKAGGKKAYVYLKDGESIEII